MRIRAEPFHPNKDYQFVTVVFISTPPFSKQEFVVHF